jgi:hypothetical protein
MEQRAFRMPATGEGWRHYKGGLYTVIGMGQDSQGGAVVVYSEYRWALAQLPPIYVRPIGEWLQQVETGREPINGKSIMKPRFAFERETGDDERCPFIRPQPRINEPLGCDNGNAP